MLWLKKPKREAAVTEDQGGSAVAYRGDANGRQLDDAVDTAVDFLRSLGRYAFEITGVDVATFGRQCEAWAKHLATGAPHPEITAAETASGGLHRDWTGARRFVAHRREAESEFIATSLGNLREIIADLTERFATTLVEDQASDRTLTIQVERLRVASELDSLTALRNEVVAVAALLTQLAEGRNRSLRSRLVALDKRVSALSEELQEVRRESSLDALTRVFNRGAFDRAFLRMHRLSAVAADPSCLVIADLDNLKTINDQYGHRAGDEALRVFADLLVRSFPRRSDFIARYGGDEMVAILPRTPASYSARLATRFLEAVKLAEVTSDGRTFSIGASLGLAEMKHDETASAWLERADRALYEAKATGRGRLVVAA
jgi:diguanylate cyclase (GGDEF)-like protein